MYITGAIATGLGTYGCIWASRRLKTGNIAIVVGALLLFANVTLYATFHAFPSLSRAGAYLLADVSVRIPVFLFWAFASEIFDARQAPSFCVSIGREAACLPGVSVGPRQAERSGIAHARDSSAMGGFMVSAAALVRDERVTRQLERTGAGNAASARSAIRTPQLASIAALAVLT